MFRILFGLILALGLVRAGKCTELSQIQSLINNSYYLEAYELGRKYEYKLASSAQYNALMVRLAVLMDCPQEAIFALNRLRQEPNQQGQSSDIGVRELVVYKTKLLSSYE